MHKRLHECSRKWAKINWNIAVQQQQQQHVLLSFVIHTKIISVHWTGIEGRKARINRRHMIHHSQSSTVGVNKTLSNILSLVGSVHGNNPRSLCVPSIVNLAAVVLSAKHPHSCVYNRLQLCLYVFQRRSGSRWKGYAGRPEATCRSLVSTSSGGANYARPAAQSCDPTWMPKACGKRGERAEEGDQGENNDKQLDWSCWMILNNAVAKERDSVTIRTMFLSNDMQRCDTPLSARRND